MGEGVTAGWSGPDIVLAAAARCPDCPVARVVQASVLDGRFWPHLLLTLLPLLVLAAIVAVIHGPGSRGRAGEKRGGGGRG
jgi:hypothetical protein